MPTTALVVIVRAPALGQVKTRLARDVGDARALATYRELLRITATAATGWPGPVRLATAGDDAAFAGTGLEHLPRERQPDGHLGLRIAAALRLGLAVAPRTIVIGSDCPGLDVRSLQAVVDLLTGAAVAFGPAGDGGFWSIATSTPAVAAVVADADVPWSTADTLAVLRRRLDAAGLPSALGPRLDDCDTEADLRRAVAAGLLPAESQP